MRLRFSKLLARSAASIAIGLWLSLSLAQAGPSVPAPTEFTVDGPGVVLKGVRYANPGKPSIVLFHGLVENSRIWREVGYRLHEMGFDVWMPNFRGHGKGAHRSTVKRYTKGSYGFEYMVTEDVPLMVEHVRAVTGQAPHLGGHSMGGMAIKEYAAGVHRLPSGRLGRSDELARLRALEKIGSVVSIGSPPHLRDAPALTRLASHLTKPVTGTLRTRLPMAGRERAPTEADPSGPLSWLRNKALSVFDPLLPRLIPKGVLDGSNLSRREMQALREKSLSAPHTDILDDFGYWVKSQRFVSRDGLSYETDRKIYAPMLYVAGDSDSLAGPAAMGEEARGLPSEAVPRIAVVADTGHVDLIAGERAAARLAPLLRDWVEDRSRIGPPLAEVRVGEKCSLRRELGRIR